MSNEGDSQVGRRRNQKRLLKFPLNTTAATDGREKGIENFSNQ